jgi:hypothetical protein
VSGVGDRVETTYRGIRWRRDADRGISFYDPDGDRWVEWAPGVDAPPRPPGWTPERVARPGRWSRWRVIPLVLVVAAVVLAVVQVLRPSGDPVAKEAKASEAMLGKCLAQHGTIDGHPKYSSTPVPCDSAEAAVKVVKVIPSAPGSPLCPGGTVGVELLYNGVKYPHIECVQALHPAG